MTTITHPFGIVYAEHLSRCTAEHMKTRSSDAETPDGMWHGVYKCVKLAEFVDPTRKARELLGRCSH